MSHLYPVADHATCFIAGIERLKLGKQNGRNRPHKLLLLLAVAELFENGMITENRIYFDDKLKALFTSFFERYKKRGDQNRPQRPFFHLRSAPFWHHKIREGRESLYKTMTSDETPVRQNIKYAYLSDEAFAALSDEKSRAEIVNAVYLMVIKKC